MQMFLKITSLRQRYCKVLTAHLSCHLAENIREHDSLRTLSLTDLRSQITECQFATKKTKISVCEGTGKVGAQGGHVNSWTPSSIANALLPYIPQLG